MDLIPAHLSDLFLESYFIRINSKSKIIYWIVLIILALFLISLPFIYVDISVRASGYFQSKLERQFIYVPFQGKVFFSNLKTGTRLSKGDTLLIMDMESTQAQEASFQNCINESELSIHDLEILTNMSVTNENKGRDLLCPRYKAELNDLISRERIQEQVYQKRKSEYDRNNVLHKQKLIPDSEYENSLYYLNAARENLRQLSISQQAIWQNDLTSRKIDIVRFMAELKNCHEIIRNKVLISPVEGEIIQSSEIAAGSIVNAGQKVAEISPEGDLIASCLVAPAKVGLLHKGQKVRLQVDAFNYNEWGLLEAEIIDISDDMLNENGSGVFFRVRCKPYKTYLTLKNGFTANVKKGMSCNARIFVIRRSLFNLLFDKVDKWFNPNSDNPV